MRKKASTPLDIGLLVVLTLVLVVGILFSFYFSEKGVKETIYIPNSIDEVYVKEKILNYHIQGIVDETEGKSKAEFVSEFKKRLEEYKFEGKYLVEGLEQVEGINEENIEIIGDKIILSLDLGLSGGEDKIQINYNYRRVFESVSNK